jgi:hypothetical protein
VPKGLGGIIEPIIKKLPRDSLLSTLNFDTALVRMRRLRAAEDS